MAEKRSVLDDLRGLDPKQIGDWPPIAKGLVIVVLCVALLGAGFALDTKDQWESLEKAQRAEGDLRKEFETKQAKAVNLDAYKAQMEEMKETFGTLLRQLPGRTEVADLLVDVTQTGLGAGLEFNLFKPEGEQRKEFYAELPISLQVIGSYHELGHFVSGVAALPRIVTLHDLVINTDKDGVLSMDAKAKTYRYLDDDEMQAQAASAKKSSTAGGKKGGRK